MILGKLELVNQGKQLKKRNAEIGEKKKLRQSLFTWFWKDGQVAAISMMEWEPDIRPSQ